MAQHTQRRMDSSVESEREWRRVRIRHSGRRGGRGAVLQLERPLEGTGSLGWGPTSSSYLDLTL